MLSSRRRLSWLWNETWPNRNFLSSKCLTRSFQPVFTHIWIHILSLQWICDQNTNLRWIAKWLKILIKNTWHFFHEVNSILIRRHILIRTNFDYLLAFHNVFLNTSCLYAFIQYMWRTTNDFRIRSCAEIEPHALNFCVEVQTAGGKFNNWMDLIEIFYLDYPSIFHVTFWTYLFYPHICRHNLVSQIL